MCARARQPQLLSDQLLFAWAGGRIAGCRRIQPIADPLERVGRDRSPRDVAALILIKTTDLDRKAPLPEPGKRFQCREPVSAPRIEQTICLDAAGECRRSETAQRIAGPDLDEIGAAERGERAQAVGEADGAEQVVG